MEIAGENNAAGRNCLIAIVSSSATAKTSQVPAHGRDGYRNA